MKIGFFDSGLGGLTILKAVAKELPEFDYEFYGDTANIPYGDRSEEEILKLTTRGVEHLFERNCTLVIIACNTASAETARSLQNGYLKENYPERKILGMIIPTVEAVVENKHKKVLLLGTKRTIASNKYQVELDKYDDVLELIQVATPKLVPMIEEGNLTDAYLDALKVIAEQEGIEGVILGCTHYTLLTNKLREDEKMKNICIYSQDEIIPTKLKLYLDRHPEIKTKLSRGGERNIHLTDNSSRYDGVIQELLGGSFIGD